MSKQNPHQLEVGVTYTFVFKQYKESGGFRRMEFIASYLGWDDLLEEYQLNLRPAAGTGALKPRDIISVERTIGKTHTQPRRIG